MDDANKVAQVKRGYAAKAKLINLTKKQAMTILIGNLYEVEERFGHLWGHTKEEDDRTDDERMFLEVWTDTRNAILDKGHSRIDRIVEEFENYEIGSKLRLESV